MVFKREVKMRTRVFLKTGSAAVAMLLLAWGCGDGKSGDDGSDTMTGDSDEGSGR
jgi:hypothetical protein